MQNDMLAVGDSGTGGYRGLMIPLFFWGGGGEEGSLVYL